MAFTMTMMNTETITMCTDLRPIEEIYTDRYAMLSTMPKCLADSLYLAKYENGRFVSDAYFRLTQADRNLIDRWLVEHEHPLAYQPGTQESRIVALVREFGA
jgi:hypothetical protein